MPRKILMTEADIRRTLARIAHEIIEHNKASDQLILIGVMTRGVPLARRLAEMIKAFEGINLAVGALDISRYRDDVSLTDKTAVIHQENIPDSVDGKTIVLIDDVLYTGRSVRAAMDALIDRGRPRSIQLAVLIDRGHREMPIRADYAGKNIPTARHEKIRVQLTETDGRDEVSIADTTPPQVTIRAQTTNPLPGGRP